jgi:hypothetical protein
VRERVVAVVGWRELALQRFGVFFVDYVPVDGVPLRGQVIRAAVRWRMRHVGKGARAAVASTSGAFVATG